MSGTHRKLHSNGIDQKQPRSQEAGNGRNNLLSWSATGYQKAILGSFPVIAFATGGISPFLVFIVIVAWHLRFTTLPQIALVQEGIRQEAVRVAFSVGVGRRKESLYSQLFNLLIEVSHQTEPISDRLWIQGRLCKSCHFLPQLTQATPQILYLSARAITYVYF